MSAYSSFAFASLRKFRFACAMVAASVALPASSFARANRSPTSAVHLIAEAHARANWIGEGFSANPPPASSAPPRRRLASPDHIRMKTFRAMADNGTAIPPDVAGAVGPHHLMLALNAGVEIESRSGAIRSHTGLASFWGALGVKSAYDPRVAYDPYGKRWIVTSGVDADTAPAIVVGVSETSDPRRGWNLYRVPIDPSNSLWADYPTMGFNAGWIAVQANIYTAATNAFVRSNIYAFDKADLYSGGAGKYALFADPTGFSDYPAQTYDPSERNEYLVRSWNPAEGTLRISAIIGAVGSEALELGIAYPQAPSGWHPDSGDVNFAAQLGSGDRIDLDDDRIENAVYRAGSVWAAHTVFLPGSGAVSRSAVDWWQIGVGANPGASQFGRIEDPAADFDYAYPTLAVNSAGDMMLGYSRFGASQYASANFAFRMHSDPAGTLRGDIVYRAGDGPYFKDFGTGDNRWGDYGSTVVDPVDDFTMWTVNEFAAPAGAWGTWWAKLTPARNRIP
jgi:hypothetical protein